MQDEPYATAIPYGYCHCGCGGKTALAKQSVASRGVVKGQPNKYIVGHQCRIEPGPRDRALTNKEKKARHAARDPYAQRRYNERARLVDPERTKRACRASYERHSEQRRAKRRERGQREKEKELARAAVSHALERGRLQRQPCEIGTDCRGMIHAHHDDYSKPLEVRWLCAHHHAQLHLHSGHAESGGHD